MTRTAFFVRVNGIAKAFCRHLGFDCLRCGTISWHMTPPPAKRTGFVKGLKGD